MTIATGNPEGISLKIGRDGGIRTHDPLTPSQVRYQAALHPDVKSVSGKELGKSLPDVPHALEPLPHLLFKSELVQRFLQMGAYTRNWPSR